MQSLTPFALIRADFRKTGNIYSYNREFFLIETKEGFYKLDDNGFAEGEEIKYTFQLRNQYFSSTGKELKM